MSIKDNALQSFFNKQRKASVDSLVTKKLGTVLKETRNVPSQENINLGQSEDKLRTNLGQSEDKLGTKVNTYLGQTEDKVRTNLGQSEDKLGTKLRTKVRTKPSDISTAQNKTYSFQSLIGLQKDIVIYLFHCCKSNRNRATTPVSVEILKNVCNTTTYSIRKSLQRLEKKKLIARINFKNGRGGWTEYELSETLFYEILDNDSSNLEKQNLGQSEDKLGTKLRTEAPYNSSSNIYNKTITTNPAREEGGALSPEWKDIDIEPLKEIGFNENHLLQLRSKNTPEVVQESINHFAYGLQFNPKTKKYDEPLTVLIGVLRKGEAWLEANYRPAHEIALEKVIEEKKKQQERAKALEEEIDKLEGEAWLASTSDEEKAEITKGLALGAFSKSIQESVKRAHLLKYFKEKIKGKKGIDTGA